MILDLNELHKLAVIGQYSDVERAVGLIDRVLSQEPCNRRARIHKGSLLTVLGESEIRSEKSKIYVQTGLAMMDAVLEETPSFAPERVEFEYLYATTVAMLRGSAADGYDPADLLSTLVTQNDFEELREFEKVRALVLLSSLAKQKGLQKLAKSLFRRASALDRDLASTIYANWLERFSS